MAKRGRKPVPTELKLLAGTRADRVNAAASALMPGAPERPGHLDDLASAEWDRMVGLLGEAGILSRIDGAALAVYCSTYSRWRRAKERLVTAEDLTVPTQHGRKVSPYVTVAAMCESQMARMLVEFGGTPSSRSRVKLGGSEIKDDLGEFLKRKNG